VSRIVAGAAGSATVGLIGWLAFGAVVSNLAGGLDGMEALGLVILFPVALFVFVLIPLCAGFAGGVLSRRSAGVAGSVVGYLAVTLVAITAIGNADASVETQGAFEAGVVVAALVAAGHFTGLAIRPRLRPA